jgi:hypothetical protein
MTTIQIKFAVTLDGTHRTRNALLPGIPRVGEMVELEPGGWEMEVKAVSWAAHDPEALVWIELGSATDTHDEGLAEALTAAGWDA